MRAIPASVANEMNGIVKISMPREICLNIWLGEVGSSNDSRGSFEIQVAAGISGSRLES